MVEELLFALLSTYLVQVRTHFLITTLPELLPLVVPGCSARNVTKGLNAGTECHKKPNSCGSVEDIQV